MSVQFYDSTYTYTLPAGINVSIAQGGTVVGTGTTDSTGTVAIAVTQGLTYTATFSGTFVGTQTFVGGSNQSHWLTDSGNIWNTDSSNRFVRSTGSATTITPVAGYSASNARITQLAAEALATGVANARITQLSAEALATGIAKARVTQLSAEALATGDAAARVTQIALEVLVQNTPSEVFVTQAVLKSLSQKKSQVRLTQAVLKTLSSASTPQYTVQDFVARIINLLPKPWFSKAALAPGGTMYVLIYAVAYALAGHKVLQLDYDKNQMRILTASGANLDNISLDYLGGRLPRLIGETDASYRVRILAAILQPKITLAAMQAAVTSYFNTTFTTVFTERPTATVFDAQSNPTLAAEYNIAPPQFVIQATYPFPSGTGWILKKSAIGYNNPLLNTVDYLPYSPTIFDPGLKTVVDDVRAVGTVPVYLARVSYY